VESTAVLDKFRKVARKPRDTTRNSKLIIKINKKEAEENQEEVKKLLESGKPELLNERVL